MPLMRACGASRATEAIMSFQVSRTAEALSTLSATPCTSDLCAMSGESTLSATGKPSCVAIIMASVALRASRVCVTGMWKADSRALDSISVSTCRRSASTPSMSSRAPSTSGLAMPVSGGGVWCSSCWLR